MGFRNLAFQAKVVEQRFRAVVLLYIMISRLSRMVIHSMANIPPFLLPCFYCHS